MKIVNVRELGEVSCYEGSNIKEEIMKTLPVNDFVQGHYFFFDAEGHLLYIGKSNNLRARVSGHLSGSGGCVTKQFYEKISCVYLKEEFSGRGDHKKQLLSMEMGLIRKFKPAFNGAPSGTTTVKDSYGYENLRSDLNEGKNVCGLLSNWRPSNLFFEREEKEVIDLEKKQMGFTEAVRESIKVLISSENVTNVDEIIDGLLSGLKAIKE